MAATLYEMIRVFEAFSEVQVALKAFAEMHRLFEAFSGVHWMFQTLSLSNVNH